MKKKNITIITCCIVLLILNILVSVFFSLNGRGELRVLESNLISLEKRNSELKEAKLLSESLIAIQEKQTELQMLKPAKVLYFDIADIVIANKNDYISRTKI